MVVLKTWSLHKETSLKKLKTVTSTPGTIQVAIANKWISIPLDTSWSIEFCIFRFLRYDFWLMMTWLSRFSFFNLLDDIYNDYFIAIITHKDSHREFIHLWWSYYILMHLRVLWPSYLLFYKCVVKNFVSNNKFRELVTYWDLCIEKNLYKIKTNWGLA